jgi:hypothetical protein
LSINQKTEDSQMKNGTLRAVVAGLALMLGGDLMASASDQAEGDTPHVTARMAIQLSDGSYIMGMPNLASVELRTKLARMNIPYTSISNIEMLGDLESARVRLCNGDVITGILDVGELELQSLLGPLAVNLTQLKKMFIMLSGKRGTSYLDGTTLVARTSLNRVEERNSKGAIVWSFSSLKSPYSAERLSNGNTLIADHGNNRVIEVDHKGTIVWSYKTTCLDAQQLANGNILISAWAGMMATEVTRDKRIVWSYKTVAHCGGAHRLPNGNTIVSGYNVIEEVTPGGSVVWAWNGANKVHGMQCLPNGNILVANLGTKQALEITPGKGVVWTYSCGAVTDAFRLPNGNTLITNATGTTEVTPTKEIVWSLAGHVSGRARR